ncbi:hypothetical protein Dda_0775 [Drechslerella dactyloides]|uniref:Yos1-like protein n=1 Tax=Drechslerella dactyloides TaxID=74499 RepID=A0AAD6NMC4_DREDA|nr:hypothetical protein Dda_0775 [Drechslerella dactyloides]
MAMLFWFGNLFYVAVLLVNAVAVLSEDRFLARIGWAGQQDQGFGGQDVSIKAKLINLISAIRTLMRMASCTVPLIAVNIIIIIYELLLG